MHAMHTDDHSVELKRTSFVLTEKSHARLKKIAEAHQRTFSQQLRHLIDQAIAEADREPEDVTA